MKTTAKLLFILCIPALLITASIGGAVNCVRLYQYGFEKYDVARDTGLTPAELDKAATGLIHYFNSGEETIDIVLEKDGEPMTLFNEREAAHLRDVKGLFRLAYLILLITLIYALAYIGVSFFWWRDRRRLAWGLIGGGGLTVLLMLALGLGIFFNFDALFRQFHLISFANDLWMLDPTSDYLIMLFPGGFWFDASLFCALGAFAGAVVLGAIGLVLLKKTRHTGEQEYLS